MVSLCFPYGSPITCVCDPRGHVYNCFPTDTKGKMASYHSPEVGRGRGGPGEARIHRAGSHGMGAEDQRTEIVLATTALVAVVALFLSFVIYRVEKYLVTNGYQLPLFHRCSKAGGPDPRLARTSASAQTDPVIYCYSHSQTVVGITHLPSFPAPPPLSNVYPSLPQRRYSYSPDSAVADSGRPSMSSTLPLPRSRSRSSPYEGDSGDQVSTPIELTELQQLERPGSSTGSTGQERFMGRQEEEVHFAELYTTHCSSQQPLLDFMKLAELEQGQE